MFFFFFFRKQIYWDDWKNGLKLLPATGDIVAESLENKKKEVVIGTLKLQMLSHNPRLILFPSNVAVKFFFERNLKK